MPKTPRRNCSAPRRLVAFLAFAALVPLAGTSLASAPAGSGTAPVCASPVRGTRMTQASLTASGAAANGLSGLPAISADGRYAAFDSLAGNLGPANQANTEDVFVRDLNTGVTEIVSRPGGPAPANDISADPALSADGRYVAFRSDATNLAGDADTAATFNGTTGQLSSASQAPYNLTGNLTIEAWVMPTAATAYNMLVTKTSGNGATSNTFELRLSPTTRLPQFLQYAGTSLQTVTATSAPHLNSWSHLAVVKSGTTVTHYLNGVAAGSGTISGVVTTNTRPLRVGARDDSTNFFTGRVDDVSIFAKALTPARIDEHYRAVEHHRSLVLADLPTAYWRLGEAAGTTAADASGLGRNGTYSGGVTLGAPGALETDRATNLPDVFLRDRQLGTTERLSVSSSGVLANAMSHRPSITGDGRYVAFESSASNLVAGDTNGALDVFVRDTQSDVTTRVSTKPAGLQVAAGGGSASISADGRFVVFTSAAADLVAGDTNGITDVFVKDLVTGAVERVSVTDAEGQSTSPPAMPAISADGNRVAFATNAALVTDDTNSYVDVYVRDRSAGTTTRASVHDDGTQAVRGGLGAAISGDGRFVAFHRSGAYSSTDPLAGFVNTFVRDLAEARTHQVSVGDDGQSANGNSPVNTGNPPALSHDGRRVVFESFASNLGPVDPNPPSDVFVHDQGPVAPGEVDRFVRSWLPRVVDETWGPAYVAASGYPADVLAEGFHQKSATQKQYLVDCLYVAAYATDTMRPTWPEEEVELRERLYDFVFDKDALRNLPNLSSSLQGPIEQRPTPATLTPGFVTDALAARGQARVPVQVPGPVPPVEAALAAGPRFEAVTEVVPQPAVPAVPAPSQAVLDGLAAPATVVADAAEAQAGIVEADAALAPLQQQLFRVLGAVPLPPSRYRACYESPGHAATCSDPVPLATPVPLDVTEDGTLDVAVLLTATVDLEYPLGQSEELRVTRLATSETTGQVLRAHVYVVFELPNLSKRISVGYDGYRLGSGLSDETVGTVTFKDLAKLAAGDLSNHYTLSHTAPRESWALTVGARTYSEESEAETDPHDASVRFSPVPQLTGDVDFTESTADDVTTRTVTVSADVSLPTTVDVAADQLRTSDGRRTTTRARLAELTGTTTVSFSQDDSPGRKATLTYDGAGLSRVSFARETSTTTAVENLRADIRQLPAGRSSLTLVREGKSRIEAGWRSAGVVPHVSFGRWTSVEGARDELATIRATGVPTRADVTYGSHDGGARTGQEMSYSGNAGLPSLDVAVHDRSDDDSTVALARGVPASVVVDERLDEDRVTVTAAGPTGSIDLLAARSGGRAYRPAGEHATFVGDGVVSGASVVLRGLRSLEADFRDPLVVNGSIEPGGQPFLAAGRSEDMSGLVELSALPTTFAATVNRADSVVGYSASTRIARVRAHGQRPSGPLVDVLLTGVPTDVDVTAALGDAPGLVYTADSTLDRIDLVYSSDTRPVDAAGTSIHGSITALPASVVASANRATSNVSFSASQPVGEIDLRFRRDGGRSHVPAGDHATYFAPDPAKFGASLRIGGLRSFAASFGDTLTAALTAETSGGLSLVGRVGSKYVDAYVADVPGQLSVSLARGPVRLAYEADRVIPELRVFATDYAGGPTARARLEGVPRNVDLRLDRPEDGDSSVKPTLVYDADSALADVEFDYSPDHVTQPATAAGRFFSVRASDLPTDLTVTVDDTAKRVDWTALAGTVTPSAEIAARGVFAAPLRLEAAVTGIPSRWAASYGKDDLHFDAFGGQVGEVAVAMSDDGTEPVSLAGNHVRLRSRASMPGSSVGARLTNIGKADYTASGDGMTATLNAAVAAPVAIDVDVHAAANGRTGTDDKRLRLSGKLTELPSYLEFTRVGKVFTYLSNGNIGGELSGDVGWVSALAAAPDPRPVHGASVTDGACADSEDCVASTDDFCSAQDNLCYGVRFVVDIAGFARHVQVDLDRPGGRFSLLDVRIPAAAGPLSVETRIDDLVALPLEHVVQSGIPQGADLVYGPFYLSGGDGRPFSLQAHTAHSVPLGKFDATLAIPDKEFAGGSKRMQDVVVTATLDPVPAVLHLLADAGEPTSLSVAVSHPVETLRVEAEADYAERDPDGAYVVTQPGAGALVELSDIPVSIGSLVTLEVGSSDAATAPPSQGSAEPMKADGGESPLSRCEPETGGDGSAPTEQEVEQEKRRGFQTPMLEFSAPAAGVDLVVDIEAPLAQVTTERLSADVRGALLGVTDFSPYASISLAAKATELAVRTDRPGETPTAETKIGLIWVQSSFVLDVPCTELKIDRMEKALEWKPADFVTVEVKKFWVSVDAHFDVSADLHALAIMASNVDTLLVHPGKLYLAYGVSGTYGTFDVLAPHVNVDIDAHVHAVVERGWSWLPDVYNEKITIDDEFDGLYAHMNHQKPDYSGLSLQAQFAGIGIGCLDVVTTPSLARRQRNGVHFDGRIGQSDPETKDVFTFLDPNLGDDGLSTSLITIATAALLGPYEKDVEFENFRRTCQ